MTKDDFDAMIEMILDEGVEITLHKEDGIRWHDLHLQMKSGMDIAYVDDVCIFKARYDRKGVIEDFNNLMWEVLKCQHGRDFMSPLWKALIEKWRKE